MPPVTVPAKRNRGSLVPPRGFPTLRQNQHRMGRTAPSPSGKAASIGFSPVEFEFNRQRGGFDFKRSELVEWSLVSIPAAPGALLEPAPKSMTAEQWRQQRQKERRAREVDLIRIGARP
jgi:hypothetical protein